jgi:hypothetical protein
MSAAGAGDDDELAAALTAALAVRTREAFTRLLTDDVHWGRERRDGNECTSRDQAGDHCMGLLATGLRLRLIDLRPTDATDDSHVVGRIQVEPANSDDVPSEMAVRLTLRNGLIADIRELDPPVTIEVLHIDGCPNHETLLTHLTELLTDNHITASVTAILIENDHDAQAHRFLGSPTVRINGNDVDPTADEHHGDQDPSSRYGMQCRLYSTPHGITGTPPDQWILDALIDNPTQSAAITAIHTGDLTTLQELLADHPGLASTRLPRHAGRTLLHVATDWPGHFPNVATTIATLVAAGADPNAPSVGEHSETPLHWAASSNDIEAIDALLDHGADIDARGAVIAGGTPMADATAFGQWAAARRLLERGAHTNLFEAAALGLVSEVEHRLEADQPTEREITSSFWGACHGGHIATAAVLLDHHADINWFGYDGLTPLDAARRSQATAMARWLEQRGASSAQPT